MYGHAKFRAEITDVRSINIWDRVTDVRSSNHVVFKCVAIHLSLLQLRAVLDNKTVFFYSLKSQVVLLQTAHSWANAGVLLGARMHRERVAFETIKVSG